MLALSILAVLSVIKYASCSLVREASTQKGIHLSDYCPKMEYCAEGTHVMCMYYNPARVMGPRCTKPMNVSVTQPLATRFLEISNAIRSKIALGKEKGKDGESFPRGYGMVRLQWDNELATFAQVLANQCVLRHDMCRATKRFPNPGQTAGLVRFSYPTWRPLNKNTGLDKPGLNIEKLEYAVKQSLKSWYSHKSAITPAMIFNAPDWSLDPANQFGRLYMEMIHGPATHMGCGISAYSEYAYYENNVALNYNSIQVICNYSGRARSGGPVYEVSPPTQVGFTIKCGCPAGMDEDASCLCYEKPRYLAPAGRCPNKDHSCRPAVVLLPIFTVENAPPDKLAGRNSNKESYTEIKEITGRSSAKQNIHQVLNDIINSGKQSMLKSSAGKSSSTKIKQPKDSNYNSHAIFPAPAINKKQSNALTVSYLRYTTSKPSIYGVKHNLKNPLIPFVNYGHKPPMKESLFSKVPTFDLTKKFSHSRKYNRDVLPRKDFTEAKNLVQSYLDQRRLRLGAINKDAPKSSIDFLKFLKDHSKATTDPYVQLQNSAEEKVITYSSMLKNDVEAKSEKPVKEIFPEIGTDTSKEKSNDKLMSLLDKLEQEVKHIELDKTKKEIFDAKIRKIYGSVVVKTRKPETEFEFADLSLGNEKKHNSDHIKYPRLDQTDTENPSQHHKNDLSDSDKNYEFDTIRSHDGNSDVFNDVMPIALSYNDIEEKFNDRLRVYRNKDKEIDHTQPYNGNDIKSKYKHQSYNYMDEINSRMLFDEKEALRSKQLYSEAEEKKKIKDMEKREHVPAHDQDDDPLSIDRRRFYQEKLDNIVRKVHNTRKLKHHGEANTPMIRRMIPPSRIEEPLRPEKSLANPFYVPDRARFLHGF